MTTHRFQPESGPQPILLNPGPVNVSEKVAHALLKGDLCHREEEYTAVQNDIRQQLVTIFADPETYTSVLITGSGTAALEAAVSSIIGWNEKMLVLINGVYGDRILKIAIAHGIEAIELQAKWTDPISPAAVERELTANPNIGVVACVHHETTTGLINPIQEIAEICSKHNATLLLDAISAIGGEELDISAWDVGAVVGTANKCIQGLPGLSFVLLKKSLMQQVESYPPRTLYLNLGTYHGVQEKGGVPFTPAIQIAYAFREALNELAEESVPGRTARYQKAAGQLRNGFEKLGLKLFLDGDNQSNTITTIHLPEGWTYDALHDALKEHGFVIYAGQGVLRTIAFRVSNMGVLMEDDFDRFLSALEDILDPGPPST